MTRKDRKVVDTEYRCGCTTGLLMPSGAAFADRCTRHAKTVENAGSKVEAVLVRYVDLTQPEISMMALAIVDALAATQ